MRLNSIDGKPACAQLMLLQEHLRSAWKFQGYVVSDCSAVTDIQKGHHYAATLEQAAAAAVKSGVDLDCEFPYGKMTERDALLKAVEEGLISEQEIDSAVRPGEEGGRAVAEALAGDFSPGGKLPVTFYKSAGQLPAFEDYNMRGRTYRYFRGEPLYPFGYGLSYTKFEYSNLKLDKNTLAANDDLMVNVDVKNTGKMAGDEVVELYLTHSGVKGAPIRALAGFRRVHLMPGEAQRVRITVLNRDLSIVDAEGVRRIVNGEVEVWVGGGQPLNRRGIWKSAGVSGTASITGEAVLPR